VQQQLTEATAADVCITQHTLPTGSTKSVEHAQSDKMPTAILYGQQGKQQAWLVMFDIAQPAETLDCATVHWTIRINPLFDNNSLLNTAAAG
jgi:hypothetical protein